MCNRDEDDDGEWAKLAWIRGCWVISGGDTETK